MVPGLIIIGAVDACVYDIFRNFARCFYINCKYMKISYFMAVLLCLVLPCVAGCGAGGASTEEYAGIVYKPQYASAFEITGAEGAGSTMVSVADPWQGARGVRARLLVLRGDEQAPRGFDGQVMRGDARRIVAMSSTHVAMLDALGALDRVVGVSGRRFISNKRLEAMGGSVVDVGAEGNVDYERLVAAEPDLVLLYGVNGASVMEGKLKELGIPFMYVGEYLEESPLGKAEWIVALAEVTGLRDKGLQVFSGIPGRYNKLKERVASHTVSRPSVLLNTPYGGNWFMPSSRNYMCRLIEDAGGVNVYDRDTDNTSEVVSMEEAFLLGSKADKWLNTGMASSMAEVLEMAPKMAELPCFKAGEVYNNNRLVTEAGGNDFYESGIVCPDVVLRDIVKILHPELVEEDFVYYHRLR